MAVIFEFFKQNLGTVAVLAVLVGILVPIILRIVKNKKRGISSCGCGCADCPMSGKCHQMAGKNAEK